MTARGATRVVPLLAVLLVTAGSFVRAAGAIRRLLSEEELLLEDLFTDYNPSARPLLDSSKTVPVDIEFSLMHIKELDVRSQVLSTTGLLILDWTDERLTWDPLNYGNMTELIVEAESLWTPEFAVINGAEKIYENYNNFRAIMTSEGAIHWEPGGVFKTMCAIDITYYPFDEQRCALVFGAWSYHTFKMNLTNSRPQINMDSYSINGEWQVLDHVAERSEFAYDCCPNERFANVAFQITIRRRHMFYVMNVILPSILTSVLLLSIFFCTPGQKVQIGVVVLLSFRIFLLNVSGNIPKTSDHIPILGIYLTCTMAITTLSMVLTVLVLNLHHVTDKPVPHWLHRLVLVYLAKLVGMCSTGKELSNDRHRIKIRYTHSFAHDSDGNNGKPSCRRAQLIITNNGNSSAVVTQTAEKPLLMDIQPNNTDIDHNVVYIEDDEHLSDTEQQHPSFAREKFPVFPETNETQASSSEPPCFDKLHCSLATDQQHIPLYNPPGLGPSQPGLATGLSHTLPATGQRVSVIPEGISVDYSRDWKKIAEVFDRLFFWLFLTAILLSTLVLFHPLIDSLWKSGSAEYEKL